MTVMPILKLSANLPPEVLMSSIASYKAWGNFKISTLALTGLLGSRIIDSSTGNDFELSRYHVESKGLDPGLYFF